MLAGLGHLKFPHDHKIKQTLARDQSIQEQTFVGLMFGTSVPATAVELEYSSTDLPINKTCC